MPHCLQATWGGHSNVKRSDRSISTSTGYMTCNLIIFNTVKWIWMWILPTAEHTLATANKSKTSCVSRLWWLHNFYMHVKKEGQNKDCVIIEEMWHHGAIPTAVSHLVRGRKCSPTVSHWILASQFNASNITVEHIYLKYNKEIKQWCTANAHVGPIKVQRYK